MGPSWVGDMVMADSLFQHLQASGNCVDVLAPGWSLPVLERMPSVHRGIELAVGHGELGLRKRRELGKALRREAYDRAIVLPRSLKSALVPYFANIPVRTGFRGEMRFGLINDIRPFDKRVLNQTVKRFAALGLNEGQALGAELPNPVLRVEPASLQAARERLNLPPAARQVVLLPGAEYGPAKCWPLEYFRDLAQTLLQQEAEVWVMGSAKDHAAGEAICEATRARNLCGETSLADAIDLLSACDTVVSNDSGLMHIAAAVGAPLIGLYGSTTPDFTPPLTDQARTIHLGVECSPCFERECPLEHFRCMRELTVDRVLSEIQVLTVAKT
ncbi:MAG: lipopolysaccharide heptosyltransferase II [Pseudomonadota bacterium]